jgi:hypothetical protein
VRTVLSVIILGAATVATSSTAFAQHHQPPPAGHVTPASPAASGPRPFASEVYGAFRFMIRDKNYQALSNSVNRYRGAQM